MRIGCFVPQGWRLDLAGIEPADQWATMLRVARAIEAAGYESGWVYDHFHTVPVPTQEPTYEAWTLMAALAASTDTLRLGQMCTSVGYRQPAYLAKVAASVDAISGGRLELGIGAGWYEHEYHGYGYPFPRPAVRIGQLGEAVDVIRRLWTEDVVDHDGEHFRLEGAICRPKPLQEPHVPIWVAGGGEQLTLRVTARAADYSNFGGDLATFRHKSNVLRGHCEEAGRDLDEITRTANFNVICGATEGEVEDRLGQLLDRAGRYVHGEQLAGVERMFRPMAGTAEQLVERLRPWVDAGLAYAICYFPDAAYDTEGLERFAREVAPAL